MALGHNNSVRWNGLSEACAQSLAAAFAVLFLQIHVVDSFDGVPEEALAQAAEFLDRIGGKELEARRPAGCFMNRRCGRE